jgi:predicted transcriptional regulator
MQDIETAMALTEYEIQILISIMSNLDRCTISRSNLDDDMAKVNFTPLATSIAIKSLSQKQMIITLNENDSLGNEYAVFNLTQKGVDWIMENQKNLPLKIENNQNNSSF